MCEHDEEIWEPQDGFTSKMNDLVQSEVNQRIAEKIELLETLYRANKSLGDDNRELKMKINENERIIKQSMNEKEKEVRREIFGGFTVGDYVYYENVVSDSCLTCDVCKGTRKIKAVIKDTGVEIEIQCKECGYGGTVTSYKSVPKQDEIRSVHLEMNSQNKWLKFYLKRLDDNRPPEKLFKTKEECQAHCDKVNAEREEKQAKS